MPLSLYPDGPRKLASEATSAGMRTPGTVTTPPIRVQRLTPAAILQRLRGTSTMANPPHPGDEPVMRDLAKIGIEPGKPLALGADEMKALNEGAEIAVKRLAGLDGHKWPNQDPRDGPAAREGSETIHEPLRLRRASIGGAHRHWARIHRRTRSCICTSCWRRSSEGRAVDGSHRCLHSLRRRSVIRRCTRSRA